MFFRIPPSHYNGWHLISSLKFPVPTYSIAWVDNCSFVLDTKTLATYQSEMVLNKNSFIL